MIRNFSPDDTNAVMNIWLTASIAAHDFIDENFWHENFSTVRDVYLVNAETFVFECDGTVTGFVSVLEKNFLGALFVLPKFQRQGIGSELLEFVLERYQNLRLTVYVENITAVKFYERRNFQILLRRKTETGHDEYLMQLS